jgi:hypothetical protein
LNQIGVETGWEDNPHMQFQHRCALFLSSLNFFSFLLLIAGFQLSTYGRDIAMGGAKEWVGWVMAHPKILKNL